MSSRESLLTREQRPSPTAPIRPGRDELGASSIATVENDKLSWITRCKRDVVSDLRSTQWKKLGNGYLLGFWIYCVVSASTALPASLYLDGAQLVRLGRPLNFGLSPGCLPNDVFDARSVAFNVFDPSGFFQITHGFGNLTFTQAKMIDLTWDIVIGRGGQAVLAYFSWKAFSTYFKLSMNTQPLTYHTFWAIFLARQPSLTGIYHLIRDSIYRQICRSRSIIIFVPFSMMFILAFPIMMSAMTGYRPNNVGFIADSENNLIPFDKFSLAGYVIHDGNRVGLAPDYVVPFVADLGFFDIRRESYETWMSDRDISAWSWVIQDDAGYASASRDICWGNTDRSDRCKISRTVSEYAEQYGFYGLDNKTGKPVEIETTFMGRDLKPPILNISAFYIAPPPVTDSVGGYFFGHDWQDPRTNTSPFANVSNMALNIQGTATVYSLDYVQEHGSCQQQNSYQWGFSFLQVFIAAILLLIWTCGTCLTWLIAHKTLEKQDQVHEADKEVPSEAKAALTFASTLQFEMAMAGKERPETLTNHQLHRAIKKDLKGGRILSNPTAAVAKHYNIAQEVWSLCKKRWFIFPMLVLMTAYMTTLLMLPLFPEFSVGAIVVIPVHTGFVFAISIGSTSRSRGFFAWAGIIVMLIGIGVAGAVITLVST